MIFLWLSIFCSTGIYIIFKLSEKTNAGLKGIIIINYLFAFLLGLLSANITPSFQSILSAKWLPIAGIIGFLFVVNFFLIGLSTRKAGIGITAIATRMSMIFPVFFSMFLFGEDITFYKLILISATLVSVLMAIYRKPDKTLTPLYIALPFILFVGSGGIDSLVKTAQHLYVPDHEAAIFSSALFGISFIAALIFSPFIKQQVPVFTKASIVSGSLLGLVNFGALYFIIRALNNAKIDSSFVFSINNLAIVVLSVIIGYSLLKERLSKLNVAGLFLSVLCIILLTLYNG